MKYRFFEHTADAKFQAYGSTLGEAFANAAAAMFSLLTDYRIKPRKRRDIRVKGADEKALLYSFLEELLFLFETEGFVPAEVLEMQFKDNSLFAALSGDDAQRYNVSGDIKAVTYNEMEVRNEPGNCMVQVVLDM